MAENAPGVALLLHRQRQQQPLDGDERVARLLGDALGGVENARGGRVEIELAGARALDFRQLGERQLDLGERVARIAAGAVDQTRRQAFLVVQQDLQHVLGGEPLVVLPQRQRLRALNEAARPLGVFLQIHRILLLAPPTPRSDVWRPKTRWPPVTALMQM